ncbi:MAG: DUF1365 domain-containing protein [Pseudomonadota bacterium]
MSPEASEPGGWLYQGHVMHLRLTPFAHRFRYRVFALLLDIDRLEETLSRLWWLGLDRFAPVGFHRRDHGPRDGSELRPWVEARLAEAGRPLPHRIKLLSFPRILGYGFMPLSVYYCEDAAGRLESVVYEVKNTFGDQHPYVLAADPESGTIRHSVDKGFFVSPFIPMDQTYAFTLKPPGERLSVMIRQRNGDGPWLVATQTGRRRPLTDGMLARLWLSHPLMSFKVIFAIHWQALRLALKGARFYRYRGPYPDSLAVAPEVRR